MVYHRGSEPDSQGLSPSLSAYQVYDLGLAAFRASFLICKMGIRVVSTSESWGLNNTLSKLGVWSKGGHIVGFNYIFVIKLL